MFCIYILYSHIADKYYVGQTDDVHRRLGEHNHPLVNTKFTAKYTPWNLVLSFPVSNERAESMRIEKFIKHQKSRKFILELIQNKENPEFFVKLIKDVLVVG